MLLSLLSVGQSKKVVAVIGSSTAFGTGANPVDSSWVNLTKKYLKDLGEIDTIYNIALYGASTYTGMPTGSIPPANRPSSDSRYNVTNALKFHPDVVLVNYPSNDAVDGYSLTETLSNLRAIYQTVTKAGKLCYITTTQPRNSATTAQQRLQKSERDSILAEFPVFALNFYNPIVSADSLTIKPIYDFDDTHVNDAGHQQLFQVVKNAGILSTGTPLALASWTLTAQAKPPTVLLRWTSSETAVPGLIFIQRSGDGVAYENLASEDGSTELPGAPFSFEDKNPLSGRSFYRLKIVTAATEFFSSVVSLSYPGKTRGLGNLYTGSDGSQLIAEIQSTRNQKILLTISTTAGMPLIHRSYPVTSPGTKLTIDISALAKGVYFLTLTGEDAIKSTRSFLKL
jgi:lysophospholipase L1-like esterase